MIEISELYMDQVEASQVAGILNTLLDRVEAGEEITLLRHGRIVGRLVPPAERSGQDEARRAVEAIKAMAKNATLGGIPIKELIDEGRR